MDRSGGALFLLAMLRGAHAVERSGNSKLGDCSASYVSQSSCPGSCPFRGNGCYAEYGFASIITNRLNGSPNRSALSLARAEAKAIDRLTGKRFLRLHVVGDASTDAAAKCLARSARRFTDRSGATIADGKRVWTYTHAWRTVDRQSWGDAVSVLASVESPAAATEAMGRGYATAIVVPAFHQEHAYQLDGLTVVPCANQTHGVTCDRCGLCRNDERLLTSRLTIGFAAHSQGVNKIKARIALPVV